MSRQSSENVDPYFQLTSKKTVNPFSLGVTVRTNKTVTLGSFPKFSTKNLDEVVRTLKEMSCYDHVMGAMRADQPKGLLYSSTEPQRAGDVLEVLIEQSRRVVTKVLTDAYKKDDGLKEIAKELVAGDKLFGKYELEDPALQHFCLVLVDPESDLLLPTLEQLEDEKVNGNTQVQLSASLQIEARKALHWVALSVIFRQTESFNFLGPNLLQKAVEAVSLYRNTGESGTQLYEALGKSVGGGLNVHRVVQSILKQLCYGCPSNPALTEMATLRRTTLKTRDLRGWLAKCLGAGADVVRQVDTFSVPHPPADEGQAFPKPAIVLTAEGLAKAIGALKSVEEHFPPLQESHETASEGNGEEGGCPSSPQDADKGSGTSAETEEQAPPPLRKFGEYNVLQTSYEGLRDLALEQEQLLDAMLESLDEVVRGYQIQRNLGSILALDAATAQCTKPEREYLTKLIQELHSLDIRRKDDRRQVSWEVLALLYHTLVRKDASQLPLVPSERELNEMAKARNLPQHPSAEAATKAKPDHHQRQKPEQQSKVATPVNKSASTTLKNVQKFNKREKAEQKSEQAPDASSTRGRGNATFWAAMEASLRSAASSRPALVEELKAARATTGKPCSLCPIIKQVAPAYDSSNASNHSGKGCKALSRTLSEFGVEPPSTTKRPSDGRRAESKGKRPKPKK